MQQYPNLDIRVYCLWLPVLRTYTSEEMTTAMPKLMKRFNDPRIVHYWDGSDAVGRFFKKQIIPDYPRQYMIWDDGQIVWDTFVMFHENSTWSEAHEQVRDWGRTIMGEFGKLIGFVESLGE